MSETALPVLIDVIRGSTVESRHRGAAVVVDAKGRVIWSLGDPELVMFPRSAIKPIQAALVMAESGAMDAFGVSQKELALACASHNGEPMHVEPVLAWIDRLGLSPSNLECGRQDPGIARDLHELYRSGGQAGPEHNNCSGKHSGFLTVCRHMGVDPKGYLDPAHPAQAAVCQTIADMCGVDLSQADLGTDGCGIPSIAMPLHALALGMARLADPSRLADQRAQACRAIVAAMAAHPLMVSGTGRACAALIEAGRGVYVVKGGAEGVYAGAWPEKGYGIALKIEDGAGRAAEIAMTHVLRHIGVMDDRAWSELSNWASRPQHNWAGTHTGVVRAAEALL
jgi:L-asparaginase II